MCVERGDRRTFVPEVDLDLAQVLPLFQQVGRIGMAQGVGMSRLLDAAGLESQTESALESRAAHRFERGGSALAVVAFGGKEQRGMAMALPLLTQEFERALGQGDVAIAIAFGAANVQEPTLGIDVPDFQAQAFPQAQAAGVNEGEANPMIQRRHGQENLANFRSGEHDREFELGIGPDQFDFRGPDALKRFFPEQFDRAEGLGGSLASDLLDRLEVDEVLAQFLDGNQVGGFWVELAELAHASQVRVHGPWAKGHQEQIVVEAV